MTEDGNPKENPQAERINNTMKNELLYNKRFSDITDVKEAVAIAVEFYNKERPHMSIDMMTPTDAATCVGELNKKWISFRTKAIKANSENAFIPENCLPLQPVRGIPQGFALQSTPYRHKTQIVN